MRGSLGEEDLGSVSNALIPHGLTVEPLDAEGCGLGLPALGMGCCHQGLVFLIQGPKGDWGAQGSFIFSWVRERVRRRAGSGAAAAGLGWASTARRRL